MSFPGSIVTELARYIHLDLYSGEVGGRGGVNFFIALFHVLGHVDHFKRIKKSVKRVGKILTPPPLLGQKPTFTLFFFLKPSLRFICHIPM